MKNLNEKVESRTGLKEKIIRKVGEKFIDMAVEPRECYLLWAFEPDIPCEILNESRHTVK